MDIIEDITQRLEVIAAKEPDSAAILHEKLALEEYAPEKAERAIRAYADKHRVGRTATVSPEVADSLLRDFYGLPPRHPPPEQK